MVLKSSREVLLHTSYRLQTGIYPDNLAFSDWCKSTQFSIRKMRTCHAMKSIMAPLCTIGKA